VSANQSEVHMTHRLCLGIGPALVLGLCLGVTGCARAPAAAPAAAPLSVMVSNPVERDVTDYADFTARIAAVNSVDVRALVSGYLEKLNFKEGALVKQGDVLFELDARPYQASLDQARARVRQDEAQLRYDEAEYERDLNLFNRGALSRSDLDRARAA
jgi:RND family efflux transporter MFP subunit